MKRLGTVIVLGILLGLATICRGSTPPKSVNPTAVVITVVVRATDAPTVAPSRVPTRAPTTGPRPTSTSVTADCFSQAGLAYADWGGAHAASAMDIIGSVGDYSTPEQFGRAGNRMSELVDQATSIKPPALYAKFHDALTQTDLYLQNGLVHASNGQWDSAYEALEKGIHWGEEANRLLDGILNRCGVQ